MKEPGFSGHLNKKREFHKITYKQEHAEQTVLALVINNQAVIASQNQKFYLPDRNSWKSASSLKPGDQLQAADGSCSILEEIIKYHGNYRLYDITVETHHNFFISSEDILVHNEPVILFTLVWVFGGGTIEFLGASVSLVAWGGLVALKMHYDAKAKSNLQETCQDIIRSGVCSSGGPEDPDPNDPRNKYKKISTHNYPNGRYEDAPYHHKNSSGRKSPGPKDGQKALDNSVRISESSVHKIGISEGEFVVLMKTAEGIYHGHVRSWNNLTQDMRTALQEQGKPLQKVKSYEKINIYFR